MRDPIPAPGSARRGCPPWRCPQQSSGAQRRKGEGRAGPSRQPKLVGRLQTASGHLLQPAQPACPAAGRGAAQPLRRCQSLPGPSQTASLALAPLGSCGRAQSVSRSEPFAVLQPETAWPSFVFVFVVCVCEDPPRSVQGILTPHPHPMASQVGRAQIGGRAKVVGRR